jgi:hypothetical protein
LSSVLFRLYSSYNIHMAEQTLHGEIAQIEEHLAKKREELKQQQEAGDIESLPDDKEVLRKVVGEQINPESSAPSQSQSDDDDDSSTHPPPSDETPLYEVPEIHKAFNSSIESAAKEARDLNNPALMDAFHDALADQLYDHLVEQGKLKKIE